MISTASSSDKAQITDITARAGVFSQEEIDCVPVMFDEWQTGDSHFNFGRVKSCRN